MAKETAAQKRARLKKIAEAATDATVTDIIERKPVALEPVVTEMMEQLSKELQEHTNRIQGQMQIIVQTAVSTLKLEGAYGISPDMKTLVPANNQPQQQPSQPE